MAKKTKLYENRDRACGEHIPSKEFENFVESSIFIGCS